MQNTHTICEISYGSRKEAVLHFSKQTKPSLPLKENKFHKIKEYIEKPLEDEHWCERIEIKIPNRLLEVQLQIIFVYKNRFFVLANRKSSRMAVLNVIYMCRQPSAFFNM